MKNNINYLISAALLIWCIVLSLPKKEVNGQNYELLQERVKQVERRVYIYESQMKRREIKVEENENFINNANARQLDSLESIYLR